jgi:N-acetylneuraminate synthase
MKIGNIQISNKNEPVIIAELGINHKGSLEKAIYLADLAIKSGAKIIKHQTHVIEDEMSVEAKKVIPGNAKISIYEIIKKNSLCEVDEKKLMNYILHKKRIFISTPFSRLAVDRLKKFKVPAFKIGSGECNNYPLVEYICKQKKPIILSTGMNSIKTIKPSVDLMRKYKVPFALLHCTNLYPTPPHLVRLEAMLEIKAYFKDAIIGLSDHTETIYSSLGAVALGASIIEKHFTSSKKVKGPDIKASMDPQELKQLIHGSKTIFLSKKGKKESLSEEAKTIAFAFASLASVKEIKKNEKFTEKNIFPIRPSNGFYKVKDYKKILGKRASIDIPKGTQLNKKLILN